MKSGLKVFAPASVANVAVGYDILGFALEHPGDEVIVRPSDHKGLRITAITGAKGKLPKEILKNTASFAAYKLLEHLDELDRGIDMEIHKKMPFSSGLGSSAASAVAGVMAVNELLKRPLTKREILHFAVLGEQLADGAYHADNVAPSLLGGMVLVRDNASLDVHRLNVPAGLYASVIHPHLEIRTQDSRSILSDQLPLDKVIKQSGNLAAFIHALYRSDFDLLRRCLQDVLIEPQRAVLIPHFSSVKNAALKSGALGCSISGAGPSIFALSDNSLIAEEVGSAMHRVFVDNKIECTLYQSRINQEGAIKL